MRKITTIILLFSLITVINCQIQSQNRDIDLLTSINNHPSRSIRQISLAASNTTLPFVAATPVIIGSVGLLTDNDQLLLNALEMAAADAASIVLFVSLKKAINRERPYDAYPDLIHAAAFEKSASMPSGHTAIAFTTATSLTLQYPYWYVAAPSYLWASTVGYSRMNIGVHYPSDVLAGAALGTLSAYLTHQANKYLQKRGSQSNSKSNNRIINLYLQPK